MRCSALLDSSNGKHLSMGLANFQNGIVHVGMPYRSNDVVTQEQRTCVIDKIFIVQPSVLSGADYSYQRLLQRNFTISCHFHSLTRSHTGHP